MAIYLGSWIRRVYRYATETFFGFYVSLHPYVSFLALANAPWILDKPVKIIKMKHKKEARILNDLYIMSA
jgi:hypothetical protein